MLSEQCSCYTFAVSNWHAWADFQIDPHEKEFGHYLEEPPVHKTRPPYTNVWYILAKLFISLFRLQAILSAQKLGLEGEVKIPGYKDCVLLTNGANMTAVQLTRLRRQFLAYTKLHPSNDISKTGSLFVQFLNTSLRWNERGRVKAIRWKSTFYISLTCHSLPV